jgi:hypothetical protein
MRAVKNEETGRWTLEGVEDDAITFKKICDNLKNNVNFKFARYGDGELFCMSGKVGRNCDKHEYFPDLGASLINAVSENKGYMVGVQPLSVSHLPHLVDEFILKHHLEKDLYNADVLHNASIDGKLDIFMNALDSRNVILVGPAHLCNLFEEMVHIVTVKINAWIDYHKIREELGYHIEWTDKPVILLSCGMMAEVLLHDFADTDSTIIDTGSVFDPYCGVYSRSYHHKL